MLDAGLVSALWHALFSMLRLRTGMSRCAKLCADTAMCSESEQLAFAWRNAEFDPLLDGVHDWNASSNR